MASPRVLITGAAGVVGSALGPRLADRYDLTLVDRRRAPSVQRIDLTRGRGLTACFEGHDAVIDLAADPRAEAPWDVVRENNLQAGMRTLEEARRAGVPKVVVASSNHVTGLYERDEPYRSIVNGDYGGLNPGDITPIRVSDPVRPDGFYAVGKVAIEAAGRFYAEEHGLCVICLRIGTVRREDVPSRPRHFSTLLTHRDLAHLVTCCLDAPCEPGFAVYYGVSANTWRFWDLSDAASGIAYHPADDAEAFRSRAA